MPAGKTLLVLLAPWITQVAAFAHIRSRPRTHGVRSVARRAAGDCDSPTSRRDLFTKAASLTALAFPNAALALAQITAPAPDQLKQYDLPRNALQDAAFAQGMASGMGSYERAACAPGRRVAADPSRGHLRDTIPFRRLGAPAVPDVGSIIKAHTST